MNARQQPAGRHARIASIALIAFWAVALIVFRLAFDTVSRAY